MSNVTATAERMAGPDETALNGLSVLFLPKNSRAEYFSALLRRARLRFDWRIHVPCGADADAYWDTLRLGGSPVRIPDFLVAPSWENDDSAVEDIDSFITACEAGSGVSAGRIILAGERDLGRGFSRPIYYWFHNQIARVTLADNAAGFAIVRRMFAFARETLRRVQPDLVVAGEWADPMCFAFRLAANQMGIASVVNRPSKLWSGRSYWTVEATMYNEAARALAEVLRHRNAAVSARARARIESFRVAPETLGYVKQNWDASDRRGWLAYHGNLARMFGVQFRHLVRGHDGPAPKPAFQLAVGHYRQPWLKKRQTRFFRRLGEDALRNMRYLYVALHKDPEQALNYQAPFWTNQLNTVALLSGALPAGYRLVVREHRSNTGRRPTRFYEQVARMPGVILIDGFDDQFKYIANADLVVTDNGSTGWEALMLGRRVITLADTFYDGARLARRVHETEGLAAAIIDVLARPAVSDPASHDRALGWMLDAEWATSAPANPADYDAVLNCLAATLGERVASPRVKVSGSA